MDKKQQFNFRADEVTLDKLRHLADLTQRTKSNWLRWIIDREWRELTTPTDNGKEGEAK